MSTNKPKHRRFGEAQAGRRVPGGTKAELDARVKAARAAADATLPPDSQRRPHELKTRPYHAPRPFKPGSSFTRQWAAELCMAQEQCRADLAEGPFRADGSTPDMQWRREHARRREELRRAALWEVGSTRPPRSDELLQAIELLDQAHDLILKEAGAYAMARQPWTSNKAADVFQQAIDTLFHDLLPVLEGALNPEGPIVIQYPETGPDGRQTLHERYYYKGMAGNGEGDKQPDRIAVDKQRQQVLIDGTPYDLTPTQTNIIATLHAGAGSWVGGKMLGANRPDQIIKCMPDAVRSAIDSSRANGYRIRPEYYNQQRT